MDAHAAPPIDALVQGAEVQGAGGKGAGTESPGRAVLLALSWYDVRIHRGVAKYAAAHGWRLDTRMANSREVVWGWRGDGVLSKLGCTALDPTIAELVESLKLPTVDLSVFGPPAGYPSIDFDPGGIGELAAKHFVERGLERFAFYPGLDAAPVRIRRDGFAAALERRGLSLDTIDPVEAPAGPRAWINAEKELGRRIAALPHPIGILSFNDTWAALLIHAIERAGLRCPEDVAVLGVDNNPLSCEALPVPLSSVALDLELWGERAAETLDHAMTAKEEGAPPPAPTLEFVPAAAVVVRRSTDVVAVSHRDVASAVQYIAEHLSGDPTGAPTNGRSGGVTVDAVVAANAMSRSGLKQAFRAHLGRSIQGEIHRERRTRIERLLLTTDRSIDSIAAAVGLSSARSLHRFFTKDTDCTPAEFRRRFRG